MKISHFTQGSVPNCQQHGETVFPFVKEPSEPEMSREEFVSWAESSKETLKTLATEHGAVLLRNYPMSTVEDFDGLINALDVENFPYEKSLSNAVRINRTERVFSANEAPPDVTIFFHHEMAQTPLYPKWIFFYCEIPSEEGGATPICRSDTLYLQLKEACPEFIEACEALGLKYTNVMPGEDDPESGMGRSWQSTLGVSTREAAESRLKELDYSWEWLEDDCLKATTPQLPAVLEVSPGRKTFFNQLIAAYSGWKDRRNDPSKAIRHGDGSVLDADAVQTAIKLSEDLAFDVGWQKGDAVIIDNRIVMHARRTFKGTRKIVASLGDLQSNVFATA